MHMTRQCTCSVGWGGGGGEFDISGCCWGGNFKPYGRGWRDLNKLPHGGDLKARRLKGSIAIFVCVKLRLQEKGPAKAVFCIERRMYCFRFI